MILQGDTVRPLLRSPVSRASRFADAEVEVQVDAPDRHRESVDDVSSGPDVGGSLGTLAEGQGNIARTFGECVAELSDGPCVGVSLDESAEVQGDIPGTDRESPDEVSGGPGTGACLEAQVEMQAYIQQEHGEYVACC